MTVRVEMPRWFRIFWGVDLALIAALTLSCLVVAALGSARTEASAALLVVLLGGLLALGLAITPVLFTRYIASDRGLERVAVTGRRVTIRWNQVVGVTRPWSGFPRDFTYVQLRTGRRMTVSRSMTGYDDLLREIRAHAPHARFTALPSPGTQLKAARHSWRVFGWLVVGWLLLKFGYWAAGWH